MKWKIGLLVGTLLPIAHSQAPPGGRLPISAGDPLPTVQHHASEIGTFTADLIPGNGTRAGYSLRYAPVLPDSETVYVDGRRLKRQRDYFLDYATGTLLFAEPVPRFATISVSYRYGKEAKPTEGNRTLPLIALSFGERGGVQLLMVLGRPEPLQDGSTWRTDAYGWRNTLRFGQKSTLEGYSFLATRKQVPSLAAPLLPDPPKPIPAPPTHERFLFQQLQLSAGSLQLKALYQDIGTGFSAAKLLQNQPGLAPEQLNQWEKEKGIRRVHYQLGLNLPKGIHLEQGSTHIRDAQGSVETRSFKWESNRMSLYWNWREAEASFTRFNDLAEGERSEWARERGLVRETQGGHLNLGFGQLRADQSQIKEGASQILRRNLIFETPSLQFSGTFQQIDPQFSRFNDLAENEKGQWARERGLTRESWNLRFAPPASSSPPYLLGASQARIRAEGGEFERRTLRLAAANWNFESLYRRVDAGFGRLGDLLPSEHHDLALEIRRWYDPNAQEVEDKERQQVLKESGLERTLQRASFTPHSNTRLELSRLQIQETNGSQIRGNQVVFNTPFLRLRMMERQIDSGFSRLGDLAPIERSLFANEQGMRRREWEAALSGKRLGLAFAQTTVLAGEASLQKESYRLTTRYLDLIWNRRSVGADFTRTADLADPERDLLSQLRGFHQQDWTAKLALPPNLALELFQFQADHPTDKTRTLRRRGNLQWKLNNRTQFTHHTERLDSDREQTILLQDRYEKSTWEHSLRWGQLYASRERKQIGGILANPLYQKTDYWRFQSQNIQRLAFTLENRRTEAEGAPSEDLNAYTAQYQLSKRVKVQVGETRALREGAPDETLRQLQIEMNLGPNSVLTYSERRKQLEGANGGRILTVGLTQTTWAGLSFSGSYQEWRTDSQNTKAQSAFALQTVKPIRLAFLTDVAFTFQYGALADQGNWQQEQKRFQLKGNWGKHLVEVAYTGLWVPGQGRAVDRTYAFRSDPDPDRNLHFNLTYKVRTLPNSSPQLIRTYHLDYKMGNRLTLLHDFQSLPESPNQQVPLGSVVQPTGFSQWNLQAVLSARWSLRGEYRIEWNDAQQRRVRKGGITLVGTMPSSLQWEFGYRLESELLHGQKRTAHTFRIAYDRKLNADRFFVLGLELTQYQHAIPENGERSHLRATLEWKQLF